MKNSALTTAALLSGMFATSAFAQGETGSPATKAGATFWVDHNVLTWSSNKVKPDGAASDTDTTSLQTTPDDLTVAIFWKDYGLYVKPNNAGGAVGLSLFPQKEIEVGVLLGINNVKEDRGSGNETDTKGHTLGLFGHYYLQLDSISTVEFKASFAYGKSETDTKVAGVTNSTEDKSNQFEIGVQYAYQIAEHFHVVPGIFFNTGSVKNEVGGTSSDSDVTGLTLNIAHFRYVF